SRSAAASVTSPGALATTVSGPVLPGPNPTVISSYARLGSDPCAAYPSSSIPSLSESAGAASAPSTSRTPASTRHGRRATQAPSAAHPDDSGRRPRNGTLSAFTRCPSRPSCAGTSVIAVSTAITTEMPVIQPSVDSSGNPAN